MDIKNVLSDLFKWEDAMQGYRYWANIGGMPLPPWEVNIIMPNIFLTEDSRLYGDSSVADAIKVAHRLGDEMLDMVQSEGMSETRTGKRLVAAADKLKHFERDVYPWLQKTFWDE